MRFPAGFILLGTVLLCGGKPCSFDRERNKALRLHSIAALHLQLAISPGDGSCAGTEARGLVLQACQSIYPLKDVYIRKVKTLKAPKFDITKLMEVRTLSRRHGPAQPY